MNHEDLILARAARNDGWLRWADAATPEFEEGATRLVDSGLARWNEEGSYERILYLTDAGEAAANGMDLS